MDDSILTGVWGNVVTGCGAMTQSEFMSHRVWAGFVLATLALAVPAVAQSQEEETLRVYNEHPRLLLGRHRLQLLQKEKQRRSLRWQQFELLMAGHAPMPEPGFAE